jgi:acyl-[acyl-carrier-protein]-phospholipid O-acyltransferase / long-chain-fatty-acid--[acyl-carrier-protein] ligase
MSDARSEIVMLSKQRENVWSKIIRRFGGAIIRWIYRIRVSHPEHIPTSGGALLLPNHVTFADAFFISAVCPRPVRFVMDEVFMAKPFIRWFVSIFNTVTIRRDQPREAIRITIDALKNGDLVCLFPEGQLTRTGALNELQRGCELIAKKAGHPLIPMWCDGSWVSIFSFERGKVFAKRPYLKFYGVTVAFGREISPTQIHLETLQREMLVCSAAAISERFEDNRLETDGHRSTWVNGYQIGQINALQRHQKFCVLQNDHVSLGLSAFSDLFGVEMKTCDVFVASQPAVWVGSDGLRKWLEKANPSQEITFFDFSESALAPLEHANIRHFPCLAIHGIVIAMSMPHPAKPDSTSEYQAGYKPKSWGKLLPGFYLGSAENDSLRVFGPAAPKEGFLLPTGCTLDAEGFLVSA